MYCSLSHFLLEHRIKIAVLYPCYISSSNWLFLWIHHQIIKQYDRRNNLWRIEMCNFSDINGQIDFKNLWSSLDLLTAQKNEVKAFFSKCDQIRSFLHFFVQCLNILLWNWYKETRVNSLFWNLKFAFYFFPLSYKETTCR